MDALRSGKIKLLFTITAIFLFTAVSSGELRAQTQWPQIAVSRDGTPISYEVYGAAEPTLVFVHGWSCDSRYFREQVQHFSKTHRVVLLDLAGHGHSGMSRARYMMSSFGEDVKAVTEAAGGGRVILIGHSMSGQVIAEAAALMPGRVIGLIGIDTLEDIEYKLTEEEFKKWRTPLEENFQTGSKKFVEGMISPRTDQRLREWILSDMSSEPPSVALSAMNEMMGQYISGEAARVFEKARVPVVCVNGEAWPVNYEANRRHMFSFDAIIIPQADHFLMMARPGEFNAALEKAIGMIVEKSKALTLRQDMPPAKNRLKEGDAPTPYSAEEIRKALPKGSWIKFNSELSGGQRMVLLFHFGKGNSKEADLVVDTQDEKGSPLTEPSSSKPLWKELQSHASFPAGKTTITNAPLKTFKGDLECWLYEVREGDKLTKYWFARELPGPPVLLEEYQNGSLERRMTMTGRGRKVKS